MLVNVVVGSAAAVLLLLRAYDGAGSLSSFLEFTLIGISGGCVFAIAASGLVLTYTTTGVFNFAHGGGGHGQRVPLLPAAHGDRPARPDRPHHRAGDRGAR